MPNPKASRVVSMYLRLVWHSYEGMQKEVYASALRDSMLPLPCGAKGCGITDSSVSESPSLYLITIGGLLAWKATSELPAGENKQTIKKSRMPPSLSCRGE